MLDNFVMQASLYSPFSLSREIS